MVVYVCLRSTRLNGVVSDTSRTVTHHRGEKDACMCVGRRLVACSHVVHSPQAGGRKATQDLRRYNIVIIHSKQTYTITPWMTSGSIQTNVHSDQSTCRLHHHSTYIVWRLPILPTQLPPYPCRAVSSSSQLTTNRKHSVSLCVCCSRLTRTCMGHTAYRSTVLQAFVQACEKSK